MYTLTSLTTIVFLLCTQVCQSTPNINPFDLEDEIREQVEELRSLVQGKISTAFNTIESYVDEVYNHRDFCLDEADIYINLGYTTYIDQIKKFQNLAESEGHNVDNCLETYEQLEELPYIIINSLLECVASSNFELMTIQDDAQYRVDTFINEVNVFDFQLNMCAGDLLCMSPLVTQIELAKVEIPQKIDTELQRASDLCDKLKVSIKQCTDDKVAQFNREGGEIFHQIASCINKLLS